jgi:hypothetical protein
LDDEENEIKTAEDDNLCLITKEPLTDKHVILKCGHKYNYIPLFNDVKTHKQKFNALESSSGQLKYNEIRCPYCRNKQNELLPYYEELGLSKTHGVNYIDPARLIHKLKNQNIKCCSYLTPNPGYNPEGDEPTETNQTNIGNCKYFKCPRNSEPFGEEEIRQICEAVTTPGLKERLQNCERINCPSQQLAAKFFSEIAATIILQLLATCELESIESLELLQKSMDILWSNFIQSLSALFLYDPLQAAISALDLKTAAEEAYASSTQNTEENYVYEPLALEPLKRTSSELCGVVTSSVLKLGTMDAIAKMQPIKIRVVF